MSQPVLIHGDGVAARCCAHLLARAGVPVSMQRTMRPQIPAIMLSDSALGLLRDVFGAPALFRNAPRIRKRIVSWGSAPVTLEHSGCVVSEATLLDEIGVPELADDTNGADGWTVFASRPLPAAAVEHRFGSRTATAVAVELTGNAEPEACWVEALDDGWLFLITHAPGSGWLLSVGGVPEELLGRSGLIAPQIARLETAGTQFPSAPRVISPLGDIGWLACGTAAMSFDPLCGDGTAHAVREAILASAVIRSASQGGNTVDLLSHYEKRLMAGFGKHLELCQRFYESGSAGKWWKQEAEATRLGLAWCRNSLRGEMDFRYRLNGFELHPVA